MNRRGWIGTSVLVVVLLGAAGGLTAWKRDSLRQADVAAAHQPEPMESIEVAVAQEREHRRSTTSIGTVMALRSVTLRNELAGTVREVALDPGAIVEEGTLLVALDVAVEEAELEAQKAQATLAETLLGRMQRARDNRGASDADVDRAKAERDIAQAQIERTKAIIERKTIRAPFRSRVGLSDVHEGQYLNEGTELTTLQGVDDAVNVDFMVAQQVAAGLKEGDVVQAFRSGIDVPIPATIVAVDARVDHATRNAAVRARIEGDAGGLPAPGASLRVQVPTGAPSEAVAVPVSALRKGPTGDHVFVVAPDQAGKTRAYLRQVESGAVLGDEVLILAGLSAGEQVAASGSFKLLDGSLVAIVNETEPAAGETR